MYIKVWIISIVSLIALKVNSASFPTNKSINLNKPWELNNGVESYVPNIFYNADSETGQIMPMTVKLDDSVNSKRLYAIERILYPTLGNPNLYVRNEDSYIDDITVLLRVEKKLIYSLRKAGTKQDNEDFKWQSIFKINKNDSKKLIEFELIPKSLRNGGKSADNCSSNNFDSGKLATIIPSQMVEYLHPTDLGFGNDGFLKALDYDGNHAAPVGTELVQKGTVAFKFYKNDLLDVCPGMYDLRVNFKGINQNISEVQKNAIRIFNEIPNKGNYTVINITDTQITVDFKGKRSELELGIANPVTTTLNGELSEKKFKEMTHDHLIEFVTYINKKINEGNDPQFINSAFISFNGDLHNGGSPLTVDASGVADTYNREASAVLKILSELSIPIVLTAGNHDGYVTMLSQFAAQTNWKKHLKGLFNEFGSEYRFGMEIGSLANRLELSLFDKPLNFDLLMEKDSKFPSINSPPGGNHINIFSGNIIRDVSPSYESWKGVPYSESNIVLFDGFNQWRKTYGPLYSSFRFGKNYFININSYDLRQHRRSGWGMYTVNYGGGVSQFQMDWIHRQMQKAQEEGLDIVLLSHHDPRGGHRGQDFPYLFKLIDFGGAKQSLFNYIKGEVVNPEVCKTPSALQNTETSLSCMHDGLQEWMRPDSDYDCDISLREGADKTCALTDSNQRYFSNYTLLNLINENTNVRTMLLGHTHYNSVEVKYGSNEELIPSKLIMDAEQRKRIQEAEGFYFLRNIKVMNELNKILGRVTDSVSKIAVGLKSILSKVEKSQSQKESEENHSGEINTNIWSYLGEDTSKPEVDLKARGFINNINLLGDNRELVILRMTSGVDLADQKINDQPMIGFSVFNFNKLGDNTSPKLNSITYYQWRKESNSTIFGVKLPSFASSKKYDFDIIGTMNLERTSPLPMTRLEYLIQENKIQIPEDKK